MWLKWLGIVGCCYDGLISTFSSLRLVLLHKSLFPKLKASIRNPRN
jgi:hypothetical protein